MQVRYVPGPGEHGVSTRGSLTKLGDTENGERFRRQQPIVSRVISTLRTARKGTLWNLFLIGGNSGLLLCACCTRGEGKEKKNEKGWETL